MKNAINHRVRNPANKVTEQLCLTLKFTPAYHKFLNHVQPYWAMRKQQVQSRIQTLIKNRMIQLIMTVLTTV